MWGEGCAFPLGPGLISNTVRAAWGLAGVPGAPHSLPLRQSRSPKTLCGSGGRPSTPTPTLAVGTAPAPSSHTHTPKCPFYIGQEKGCGISASFVPRWLVPLPGTSCSFSPMPSSSVLLSVSPPSPFSLCSLLFSPSVIVYVYSCICGWLLVSV